MSLALAQEPRNHANVAHANFVFWLQCKDSGPDMVGPGPPCPRDSGAAAWEQRLSAEFGGCPHSG